MKDFSARFADWASSQRDIEALVLIGSRQRPPADELGRADGQSDWDFHVIARRSERFADRGWTSALERVAVRVYSVRRAAIGAVPRVTAVLDEEEADIVVLPAMGLRVLKLAARLGLHRRPGLFRQRCQDLAVVIRPGWTFLKRHPGWERWYARVVKLVPDPRVSDAEALALAENFAAHWIWTSRKLARGELRAAQRTLVREIAEINLRLLHELKLRRGQPSFPEARRLERVASPQELDRVTLDPGVSAAQLEAALGKSRASLAALMSALLGRDWSWPL